MRCIGLGLAVIATACVPPARNRLPSSVALVAHLREGGHVSLLVDLRTPQRRPVVRVAEGAVSFDGRDLVEVAPVVRRLEDGTWRAELRVQDLLGTGLVQAQLVPDGGDPPEVALAHLSEHSATVRVRDGTEHWMEVDLLYGSVTPSPSSPPLQRFERYGPDRGFAVTLEDERLSLSLPHTGDGGAIPLLDGVDAIVGVQWIPRASVPAALEEPLAWRFKTAGSLVARALPCSPDGDLLEWSGDPSFPVDSVDQVLRGEQAWAGPRDASFTVAARLSGDDLCAAIRLRDDDLRPAEDAVEIAVDGVVYRAVLPAAPTRAGGPGIRVAFTDRVAFGMGLEACAPGGTWEADDGIVPFRVLFRDEDAGEEPTLLATAPEVPWPALAGIRLPRLARGEARGRP